MKQIVKTALRSLGLEVRRLRRAEPETVEDFVRAGRVPWGCGYNAAKDGLIAAGLANGALLEVFRVGGALPAGYGVAIDERCVEYPWLFAHLRPGPERVLDAGSALNHEIVLQQPLLREKKLHIVTLAPEAGCHWTRGIGYLYEDLRALPIRDGFYGTVACVSTIEHVGCDNTFYGDSRPPTVAESSDFEIVMRELRRVLQPGGQLLLTVPFGAYRHYGRFQQFDLPLLQRAITAFGPVRDSASTFYRYSAGGWNVARAAECADCRYVEWINWPREQWPRPLPVEPDRAAAARAVGCVRLVKE